MPLEAADHAVAARMPQRLWGATVNPLAFNVVGLISRVLSFENPAKFILSSSKESPSAQGDIQEMVLVYNLLQAIAPLSFMILLIFWRIGVHQCRADGGAVAVFS